MVTLSGSHVFTGATVAVSGLGSALAVAMVVAGRGDPILAALRSTDWMCAPGGRLCSFVSASTFPGAVCTPWGRRELKQGLIACTKGACMRYDS